MSAAALLVAVSVTSCGDDKKEEDEKEEGKEEAKGSEIEQIAEDFCDCAGAADVLACMDEWTAKYGDMDPPEADIKRFEELTEDCQEEISNAIMDQSMDEMEGMDDEESSMDDMNMDDFEANICDCINLMTALAGMMQEAGQDPEKLKALEEEYAAEIEECDGLDEKMSQEEIAKAMADCQ